MGFTGDILVGEYCGKKKPWGLGGYSPEKIEENHRSLSPDNKKRTEI
jgi:hypothetical protein